MFIKLALSTMGTVFGSAGFVTMLVFNLIRKQSLFASFLGGLIGAIGFFTLWCLLSYMLLTLFSSVELNQIFFNKKTEDSETQASPNILDQNTLGDSEDLTVEDLYKTDILTNTGLEHAFPQSDLSQDLDPTHESKSITPSHIDSDGKFTLQHSDKAIRATPKEAALAARKVLFDDKAQ